ncbi:MAG: hypothetical protein V4727_00625 [Verrucomicrobiota bacterium]
MQKTVRYLAGLGLLLFSTTLHAQELLKPPFGVNWGDSPEKLVSWASEKALDLTITIPGNQPNLRIIKIAASKGTLPDSMASSVEGKFLHGGLYEMTVHYEDSAVSTTIMEERFEKIKKQITSENGALQTNQQHKAVENHFVTRTQAFHRESLKGVFLLIAWTEVEDLLRKTRQAKFSMIYRNDNYKAELEAKKVKD